jgi:hypothetical protein
VVITRVRGRHCVDLTGIRTLGMPAVAKRG